MSRCSWYGIFTRLVASLAILTYTPASLSSYPTSTFLIPPFDVYLEPSISKKSVKMHIHPLLTATALLPIAALAAPAGDASSVPQFQPLYARENLCHLSAPPQICQPNSSVTVEETALRAYKFYRAFVVDGDPRTMFSYIDSVYQVIFPHSLPFYLKSDGAKEGK